jgi:pseudouridine-5'-phosphate glycosidase
VIGNSSIGAATVASTMRLAHLAGISTFVTGGIGGVHRNGETTMDVSADLTELGRTPVVVVCAGIKSILDVPRTMEVLETLSVPTVGWQTDEFPAFFSPHSGVPCPARVDTADDVAAAYWAARALGLPSGMLVAVPNMDPAGANVERAIQAALHEAQERGIRGQDVTPFVLKAVAAETEGDSLRSNMALVRRNARVGADIAIAISKSRSAG